MHCEKVLNYIKTLFFIDKVNCTKYKKQLMQTVVTTHCDTP